MTPQIDLYSVPAEFWNDGRDPAFDFSSFSRDALAIERRILKAVNLDLERSRYILCCRRIQEAAARVAEEKRLPKLRLGSAYLDVLRAFIHRRAGGLPALRPSACFFTPDAASPGWIGSHIDAFARVAAEFGFTDHPEVVARLAFFENAQDRGDAVVEVLRFDAEERMEGSLPQWRPEDAGQLLGARHRALDEVTTDRSGGILEVLIGKIHAAVEQGGAVNFSSLPHNAIAEALHTCVYQRQPGQDEKSVRVVYADGSEAAPLPLYCLAPAPDASEHQETLVIKAALISMRHPEMDQLVDFAWFRNRKVSAPRPAAEIDEYCASETTAMLARSPERRVELHLYQTGLEPAVVGFYRGLVRVLSGSRADCLQPQLRVKPFYYMGPEKGYRPGSIWS
jgi:hypothetical protein